MGTRERLDRIKRVGAGVAVAAVAAIAGLRSLAPLAEDAAAARPAVVLAALLSSPESRVREALGADYPLYRCVRETVPPGVALAVAGGGATLPVRLASLLAPQRVGPFDRVLAERLARRPGGLWVVAVDGRGEGGPTPDLEEATPAPACAGIDGVTFWRPPDRRGWPSTP